MSRLIPWLSARQYAPEGGFSGRTNKLVDGCYSHWVGGCWPLIEASLNDPDARPSGSVDHQSAATASLFSRNGLIRYIMCCCQDLSKRGGLRDKPSKLDFPVYYLDGLWLTDSILGIQMRITHATYYRDLVLLNTSGPW